MSNRKVIGMAAAAMLTLFSACGKGDFNGTYTGSISSSSVGTTGTANPYAYYGGGGTVSMLTMDLAQNGDSVSGTFNANGITGQITASARNANSLSDVQMVFGSYNGSGGVNGYNVPMGTGVASNCMNNILGGSLNSEDHDRHLTGSLQSLGSQGYNYYSMGMCTGLTVNLTRQGK